MLSRLGSKATYSNVMSTIAVFLAIGGGTFAFAALGKDTVGTKQIEKNAVRAAEIAKNAVTTKKIANGAVTDRKLGAFSVGTDEIDDGAVTGAKVDEATLGQVPSAARAAKAENVLFVSVNSDGTIAAQGQPGTTVTKAPLVNGRYTVSFGRDLSGCSAAATIGFNGPASAIPNDAVAGATIETFGQSSQVTVQTRDLASAEEDNNFHLIVTC